MSSFGGLRITAGKYGGRGLKTPVNHKLRPTRDMVRQAAFSILQSYIEDWQDVVALDLFCGSGALGLEALSRGAKWVGFVDMYPQYVQENIESLKLPESEFGLLRKNALNIKLSDKKALRLGSHCPTPEADLIIADPPYNLDLLTKLLQKNASLGKQGSLWLLESESQFKLDKELKKIEGFKLLKDREYGENKLWILRKL